MTKFPSPTSDVLETGEILNIKIGNYELDIPEKNHKHLKKETREYFEEEEEEGDKNDVITIKDETVQSPSTTSGMKEKSLRVK